MAYQGERSFSDVFQDIIGNVQNIIRSEIQLAKTEVKEETSKAAKASAVIAIGAVLGLYSIGFLLLTLVRGLENVTAPWLATLIVAVLVGVVAFTAISVGRTRMKQVHPTPDKTIQTVKENVEWAKDQTR
jgi:hypothetical protein